MWRETGAMVSVSVWLSRSGVVINTYVVKLAIIELIFDCLIVEYFEFPMIVLPNSVTGRENLTTGFQQREEQ